MVTNTRRISAGAISIFFHLPLLEQSLLRTAAAVAAFAFNILLPFDLLVVLVITGRADGRRFASNTGCRCGLRRLGPMLGPDMYLIITPLPVTNARCRVA